MMELMLSMSVLTIGLGMAVPRMLTLRDDMAIRGAVRYMAAQAILARFEAARTGAAVGIRFEPVDSDHRFTRYIDGNGDGIRPADIARGVDIVIKPPQLLRDQFPSVDFALAAEVPAIGAIGAAGADFDPIRLGSGDTLTFSPLGTATSGTVYLRGRTGQQYAMRILGTTGRVRVLRFDSSRGVWLDR